MKKAYSDLVIRLQRIADIAYSSAVLNWDMEPRRHGGAAKNWNALYFDLF